MLLLKKKLYGLKQASANWHEMLKGGLELQGFKESTADPCVFIKSTVASSGGGGSTVNGAVTGRDGSSATPAAVVHRDPGMECINRFRDMSFDVIVLV